MDIDGRLLIHEWKSEFNCNHNWEIVEDMQSLTITISHEYNWEIYVDAFVATQSLLRKMIPKLFPGCDYAGDFVEVDGYGV